MIELYIAAAVLVVAVLMIGLTIDKISESFINWRYERGLRRELPARQNKMWNMLDKIQG